MFLFFLYKYIYKILFFLFFFYSFYFKFIYVNILVWFVVLVFVSDEGVKPKAHVFCIVLCPLELHSTNFFFTVLHNWILGYVDNDKVDSWAVALQVSKCWRTCPLFFPFQLWEKHDSKHCQSLSF